MQPLARTSIANGTVGGGTAYTAAQVAGYLASGGVETAIFERLDRAGRRYADSAGGDLSGHVDYGAPPTVTHDSSAAIMRTLRMRLFGDAPFTPFADQVRVRYRLAAPDGGWLEWQLGVFLMEPQVHTVGSQRSYFDLEGADYGKLLADNPFLTALAVPAGTSVLAALAQVLAGYGGAAPLAVNVPDPGKALPYGLGWATGDSRLGAVNDLLAAVAYLPAWFDERGVLRSSPLPDYTAAAPLGAYALDATSQPTSLLDPLEERTDPAGWANRVVVVVDHPAVPPAFSVTYDNLLASSPVSIPNIGYVKAKRVQDSRIVDVATAYARARSEAQAAARVFQPARVPSLIFPAAQNLDLYRLAYSTPDEGLVERLCVERKWTTTLRAGGTTVHELERVYAP